MKKEYVKPYLAVESFQLDASIASNCGAGLGHDPTTCSFEDAYRKNKIDLDIYYGPACQTAGGIDMMQYNRGEAQICYHGPAGTYSLLSS